MKKYFLQVLHYNFPCFNRYRQPDKKPPVSETVSELELF